MLLWFIISFRSSEKVSYHPIVGDPLGVIDDKRLIDVSPTFCRTEFQFLEAGGLK
jgi:hypothetical protein